MFENFFLNKLVGKNSFLNKIILYKDFYNSQLGSILSSLNFKGCFILRGLDYYGSKQVFQEISEQALQEIFASFDFTY